MIKTDQLNSLKAGVYTLFKSDIRQNRQALTVAVLATLFVIGVYIRYRLIGGINGDYTIYIEKWYDHLNTHGFAGFGENFANYNFPYLFLLYLATLVAVPKLIAVKLISIAFDFVLCLAVYKVIKKVTNSRMRSLIGGFIVFFLPTVFINSAFWGQTDAIYTSFILFSLLYMLRKHYKLGWLFFGVALSFKLQAVFFVPVLAYIWFNAKGSWYDPFISFATFIALSIPPWLAGRPLIETLTVYMNQYGFEPLLSANMPNFYYWLPQSKYAYINGVGVLFAVAIVVLITYLVIMKMKYTKMNLVLMTALVYLVVPYILPQMHDRYYFIFEVMTVVLAMINTKFIFALFAMQFVTLNVYVKTLVGPPVMPFNVLASVMLIVVAIYSYYFISRITPISDIEADRNAR